MSATAVRAKVGMTPVMISNTLNASAATNRNSMVGRLMRRVATIAPQNAPTASAVDSSP